MTAPRLEIRLEAIEQNTRTLVGRLAVQGITVTGVNKATLGCPAVGRAMLRGGATGLGDSRVESLARARSAGITTPLTLVRTPMLSQVGHVVRDSDTSLNTEPVVLDALSAAAVAQGRTHAVVLMVELGDLREGVAAEDVVALARSVGRRPGLVLSGLGTNLACRSGVVPDQTKMDELSRLVEKAETACRTGLRVVSGGNSAGLAWALTTADPGRVNELRLGEAILLGTEPLHREPIEGLATDAFTLVAEIIEARDKPSLPWGVLAQTAFGAQVARPDTGLVRQAIVALGRQDVDPDSLVAPPGVTVLAMSSDHLVVDLGDHDLRPGDELSFGVGYSGLLRAMTSPFVAQVAQVAEVAEAPSVDLVPPVGLEPTLDRF
ncbi:alanine/ornithine racemase family PLP-dependent enzyme [Nocardioides sp.]|uniref:alanine/ornithine racemase family PLP-dependent enzyme n=1 Tax=Nocardioides sp. TaxID=35761 RepID=UPI00273235A2|nr:alanine/ornithine racemase family PLP-dependent enzyme [Nocardioides sp.]MDP3889860.1 alanine/ornithine racemase family PLP-dependent enzyme [Nocardioides sp.]